MNTLAGLDEPWVLPDPALPPVPPRLMAWPGNGVKAVPRAVNACNELPSNPFADVGWSCGGVGTALYIYALDAATGACVWSEEGEATLPVVTVTAMGRTLPSPSCRRHRVDGSP